LLQRGSVSEDAADHYNKRNLYIDRSCYERHRAIDQSDVDKVLAASFHGSAAFWM